MPESYMHARTQGIGELIEHNRLFRVPDHQRDFMWRPDDEVEQFLDDIIRAFKEESPDYFMGLIVLVSPREDEGAWEILDGQQRLATTTMTYAAIREWLHSAGIVRDAEKIQNDFIGMVALGEAEDKPRLTLNISNRDAFQELVVNRSNDQTLATRHDAAGRYSSERKMIGAAIECRQRIARLATEASDEPGEQAKPLYKLAEYLRDKVKIVVMDVASTANAYVIFEVLNDRGLDLSVLDLVKNHLFGRAGGRLEEVQFNWSQMASNLGDRQADDFLKVHWTSKFGRVQRGQFFYEWQQKFDSFREAKAVKLSKELVTQADRFAALDIADHDVWDGYSKESRRLLKGLSTLGNRQVRPIILAALEHFTPARMEHLLRHLTTLTVRYQTVGKGRTGLLEIAAARAALGVSAGTLNTPKKVWDSLAKIGLSDDDFRADFMRYAETKQPRARYILGELEAAAFRKDHGGDTPELTPWEDLTLEHVFPRNPSDEWKDVLAAAPELREEVHKLGNLCLLAERPNKEIGSAGFLTKANAAFKDSKLRLTSSIAADFTEWTPVSVNERQRRLAELALEAWPRP